VAKDKSYAEGYNAYRVNYRLTAKETAAQDAREADYQRAFSSGRVGPRTRDNSAYAKGKRERSAAALEVRRDLAERTYGTRDLRRIPKAGGTLREARQAADKSKRESFARAKRDAAKARARTVRVRG
jgi:hypothetical protein